MFQKLRNRFLLLNMAVTFLVMVAAFSAVYLTTLHSIQNENQKKLSSMSKSLSISSENRSEQPATASEEFSLDMQEQGTTVRMVSSDYSPSFTVFVNKNGSITNIDSILDLPEETYSEAAEAAWKKGGQSAIRLQGRLWMYSVAPMSITRIYEDGRSDTEVSDDSFQISFLDITDTQKTLRDLFITFALVAIVMLAVIFLISLYFANRSMRPVTLAWEKQRQFIADASHELKTPLSIITANYDALISNEEETIKSQREWLDYMKIGTDRMAKLINDLLALARMENANIEAVKEPFNISNVISDVIESMKALLKEKGLLLSQSVESDVIIHSDREAVKEIFMILLENAIKYSDRNGIIHVSLQKDKHHTVCSVQNSGKIIAKEDLSKIFDRFYRGDPSHTAENSGHGLGLAIAKASIERPGGSITAESAPNDLITFTFILDDVL